MLILARNQDPVYENSVCFYVVYRTVQLRLTLPRVHASEFVSDQSHRFPVKNKRCSGSKQALF